MSGTWDMVGELREPFGSDGGGSGEELARGYLLLELLAETLWETDMMASATHQATQDIERWMNLAIKHLDPEGEMEKKADAAIDRWKKTGELPGELDFDLDP